MPATGAEKLLERLAHGEAPPVVALLGDDPYWRELCRKKLVEALVPEAERSWALTRVSAGEEDAGKIVSRAAMRPMLAPRQILFVGDVESWETGTDKEMEDSLAALKKYFDDPAPFTWLVLEAPKLDQRTRLARLVAERAWVVDLDTGGADPARLAGRMAAELGIKMDAEATAALVEATAGKAARMAIELEKLACHAGESRRVLAADVRELVVAESETEVWELAGMLAAGERRKAVETVDNLLRKGETAPKLIGALAWMYRKLVAAAELPQGVSSWQAAKRLGMRPEAAGTAAEHAHRLSRAQLADALVALAEADDRLKSAVKDERGVMMFLMARLSRPEARPRRQ